MESLKKLVVAFIILAGASSSYGQGAEPGSTKPLRSNEKASIFVSAYMDYVDGIKSGREITITTINGEVGYYLFKNLAVTGSVYHVKTVGERVAVFPTERLTFDADTSGWGLGIGFRFDIIRRQKTSIFIDLHGGRVFTSDPFPPGGTGSNYMLKAGMGGSISLMKDIDLMGGLRYVHISNGKKGRGFWPNPGYDGFGFFIGLLYGFL